MPRDRGKLLHALMREIWAELKTSSALQGQDLAPVIERAAAAAVKEVGLEGRFAELERVRLARLAERMARRWRRRASHSKFFSWNTREA